MVEIQRVNDQVNISISPEQGHQWPSNERWTISPASGDGNDYAVTKRAELLEHGWPYGALLLSNVATFSGQPHLVLVVRTKSGDLVLDNLIPEIRAWFNVPYRWIRIQQPQRSNSWAMIADPRV
jgi:predicted transglutaminase-like cysteine proteinase